LYNQKSTTHDQRMMRAAGGRSIGGSNTTPFSIPNISRERETGSFYP
jgi:hypothetical protein